MYKIRRVDPQRREELLKKIKRFIHRLQQKYPLHQVYLYGSFARDELHEGSDIDIIIVGDIPGSFTDRISTVLEYTDLPIEPLVYTLQEFNKIKQRLFFDTILADAITIMD